MEKLQLAKTKRILWKLKFERKDIELSSVIETPLEHNDWNLKQFNQNVLENLKDKKHG
jgi:hypothetical protein